MTIKILVCGNISTNWKIFVDRLNVLQNSNAGPFHVVFIIGDAFSDQDEFVSISSSLKLPIPAYIMSKNGIPINAELPENLFYLDNNCKGPGLVTIMNLTIAYYNKTSDQTNINSHLNEVRDIVSSSSYRGCDLLLSNGWPADVHQFIEEDTSAIVSGPSSTDISTFASLVKPRYHFAVGKNIFYQRLPYKNIGDNMTAERIHPCTRFIGLSEVNDNKDKNKKYLHAISISPIIHMKDSEISDIPNGATDCPYVPIGVKSTIKSIRPLDDNVNDITNKRARMDMPTFVSGNNNAGKFDNLQKESTNGGGAFFFGHMGANRPPPPNTPHQNAIGSSSILPLSNIAQTQTTAPNSSVKTLFLGGLTRHTTEFDIMQSIPNIVKINRVEGKSFAFIDFKSHQDALEVMNTHQKTAYAIHGKIVSLGWGKSKTSATLTSNNTNTSSQQYQPHIYGHAAERSHTPAIEYTAPSEDATVLFIGQLPSTFLKEELLSLFPDALEIRPVLGKNFCFLQMSNHDSAKTAVQRGQDTPYVLRGVTLAVGWAKQSTTNTHVPGSQQNRGFDEIEIIVDAPSPDVTTLFIGNLHPTVTTQELQSLFDNKDVKHIFKPNGKNYAFIDFYSHIQAQQAYTTYIPHSSSSSGSGISGEDDNRSLENTVLLKGQIVKIGWAKGKTAEHSVSHEDCWFCLASPTIKAHLILSVAEHVYLASPRGAITPDHVLIIPIECSPNRLMLSLEAKQEYVKYENALQKYIRNTCKKYMLLFERTLRTRGRDHMQTNVIPLTASQCETCLSVFLKLAEHYCLTFTEIHGDKDIDDVVLNQDEGPYQEYFYIQIPLPSTTTNNEDDNNTVSYKRFIYVPSSSSSNSSNDSSSNSHSRAYQNRFPMMLGLEIAAEAIGQPERGNWKNCIVSEIEEERISEKFKEKFGSYDFTM